MSNDRQGNGLLYEFKRPSEEAYEALRSILASIGSRPFQDSLLRKRKDAILEADLSTIVNSLRANIDKDSRENIAASHKQPWDFDYRVVRDDEDADAILVLTRLYQSEQSGKIFYGRMIRRVEEDRYLLWIDD